MLGHAADVDKTVSCWSISHHSSTHCGYCSPCIMRRLACLAHGVDDVDYELDVLGDLTALDKDDAKDTLVHFIQLADEFNTRTDFDLEMDHPEFINGASGLGLAGTLAPLPTVGAGGSDDVRRTSRSFELDGVMT